MAERRRRKALRLGAAENETTALEKVALLNDDYMPHRFVIIVLRAGFGMNEGKAHRTMLAARRRGAGIVAMYMKDIARTETRKATEAGRGHGYPLSVMSR